MDELLEDFDLDLDSTSSSPSAAAKAQKAPELLATEKSPLELFLEAPAEREGLPLLELEPERPAPIQIERWNVPAAQAPAQPVEAAPPMLSEWIEKSLFRQEAGEEEAPPPPGELETGEEEQEDEEQERAKAPEPPHEEPVPARPVRKAAAEEPPPRQAPERPAPAPQPVGYLPPGPEGPPRPSLWGGTPKARVRDVPYRTDGSAASLVSNAFTGMIAAACYCFLQLCLLAEAARAAKRSRWLFYAGGGLCLLLVALLFRPAATQSSRQNTFNPLDMEIHGRIRVPPRMSPVQEGPDSFYLPGLKIRFDLPEIPLRVERRDREILFTEAGRFTLSIKGISSARAPTWLNVLASLGKTLRYRRNRIFITSQPCTVRMGEVVFRPKGRLGKKGDKGKKEAPKGGKRRHRFQNLDPF